MKTEGDSGTAPVARARREQKIAATDDASDSPGGLRRHDLMLLHGQPGTAADWHQVSGRLPAQLRVVAPDRPGYGSSPQPPAGFAANASAVVHQLDLSGIRRAVLVGHSYGGGVALSAAGLAPHRIEAVVLLASVGPGCVSGWDRLLAAPGAGPLSALVAWRLTPWIARARLAWITRLRDRPLTPSEHVNWQVWAHASQEPGLWRTFLLEQHALLRELDELVAIIPSVQAPTLVLADPNDKVVPLHTARRLTQDLPNGRLQLIEGAGHHLPRRAPGAVADAIAAFLAAIDSGRVARGISPPGLP
ncbi:MAG TPA: alpha/beta hydrolase [Trebonia sp.]